MNIDLLHEIIRQLTDPSTIKKMCKSTKEAYDFCKANPTMIFRKFMQHDFGFVMDSLPEFRKYVKYVDPLENTDTVTTVKQMYMTLKEIQRRRVPGSLPNPKSAEYSDDLLEHLEDAIVDVITETRYSQEGIDREFDERDFEDEYELEEALGLRSELQDDVEAEFNALHLRIQGLGNEEKFDAYIEYAHAIFVRDYQHPRDAFDVWYRDVLEF